MADLQLSKYIETVRLKGLNNLSDIVLIYNTRTSALIAIDSSSFYRVQNKRKINLTTYKKLIQFKILVKKTENELKDILKENNLATQHNHALNIVIQPSANCSLACDYCGQNHVNHNIKKYLCDKLIKRIKNKIILHKHKILHISWFGGEPLLGIQKIRYLSPKLQQLSEDAGLSYSSKIVTNGLSLSNDMAHELFYKHKITNIEITLDGIKKVHDQRRLKKTQKGSFDQIYRNIIDLKSFLIKTKAKLNIRCNVDDRNIQQVPSFIDMLNKDNILNLCSIYFAPIHSWGNDADQLIKNTNDWANHEIEWFIQLKEKKARVKLLHKRLKNICIAVDENAELIDPYGGIYKCTEVSLVDNYIVAGKNKYLVDHVATNNSSEFSSNPFNNIHNMQIISKYQCANCNLFPICGGGCPKSTMEGNVVCPPIKFNIKQRMVLEYIWNSENSLVI